MKNKKEKESLSEKTEQIHKDAIDILDAILGSVDVKARNNDTNWPVHSMEYRPGRTSEYYKKFIRETKLNISEEHYNALKMLRSILNKYDGHVRDLFTINELISEVTEKIIEEEKAVLNKLSELTCDFDLLLEDSLDEIEKDELIVIYNKLLDSVETLEERVNIYEQDDK